jgi:hypothetical protein
MSLVTPAYIAAARRNMNMRSGLRLKIAGPSNDFLPNNTLWGEIHINFEEAHARWDCLQLIQGRYVRLASTRSWPITVAVTPPFISRITSIDGSSIDEQRSDALEFPPDVCVCVAQWLTDCDLLATCFKASAVCHTPGALQGARVGIIFVGDHEPQPACVVGSRKHARVRGRTLDNDSDVAKDDQWTGREVHSVSQSF